MLSYLPVPAADSIRRRYPELFGSRPTSPLAGASDVHSPAQQPQEQISAGRPTMRQQNASGVSESPMRRLLQVCHLVL